MSQDQLIREMESAVRRGQAAPSVLAAFKRNAITTARIAAKIITGTISKPEKQERQLELV